MAQDPRHLTGHLASHSGAWAPGVDRNKKGSPALHDHVLSLGLQRLYRTLFCLRFELCRVDLRLGYIFGSCPHPRETIFPASTFRVNTDRDRGG